MCWVCELRSSLCASSGESPGYPESFIGCSVSLQLSSPVVLSAAAVAYVFPGDVTVGGAGVSSDLGEKSLPMTMCVCLPLHFFFDAVEFVVLTSLIATLMIFGFLW